MNEEFNNHRTDIELEARIVALVLGEASEQDREQLSRLIEERPELAAFKSEIEAAHGLMSCVGTTEWPASENDWKLSPEKRGSILAVIRGESSQFTTPSENKPAIFQFLIKDKARWSLLRIAAAVCGAGVFGLLAMAILLFNRGARMAQSNTNGRSWHRVNSNEVVASRLAEAPAASNGAAWMFDGEHSSEKLADFGVVRGPVTSQSDDALDSTLLLSEIRDNPGRNVTLPMSQPNLNLPADSPALPSVVAKDKVSREQGVRRESGIESKDGFAAMVLGGEAEVRSTIDGTRDFVKAESESEPASPDKPATTYFGFQESPPAPVAAQQRPRYRIGATFEANRSGDAGNAIDGVDADHDGDGVDDSVWVDDRTPRIMIPESEEKAQTGFEGDAVVNGPMEIAVEEKARAQRIGDRLGGGIAMGRRFATKGIEDARRAEGAEGLAEAIEVAKEQAAGDVFTPRQDALGTLDGVKKRELQENLKSVDLSLGEEAMSEVVELIESTRGTKAVAASGLNESNAAVDAFSTFSLHVSDVSFKLAQAALARGEWPEAAKVRIEEFVNAFDYGDPMPSDDEKVACRVEQSIHPFLQQRNLLRVSMRTAAAGRASNTPLRITFLLDNSGSMERIDRQQTVRSAFALLAQQLTPIDQVTLISFARQPRLLADKVNGAQSKQLVDLIDELPSEGGTNLEAALKLAFEKASEQQLEGAQNRIVLLTDGAVNLGDANPESLAAMITAMRDAGIAFDAAGISAEGLNDEVLETLTRKGDGRYYLLDSVESADDGFVRQIAGALRPSAKNVKVQVEFNPKRVGRYKLLGYEKHLLKQEDFRNDNVDAAEMAAAEAGVAVYQFETLPSGEGDVGSVSVRFRDLSTDEMVESRWPIPYEADAQRADQAAPSMCIATSAALFAAKLRGEPLGEAVDLKTLSELLAALPEQDRNAKRVQQLQSMINQALQVGGNP